MSRTVLTGLRGTSPLEFLAALGLLRVLSRAGSPARLGFLVDAAFEPFIERAGLSPESADAAGKNALAAAVADDAARCAGHGSLGLTYEKVEKKGVKKVADLKAPPETFRRFLDASVERWRAGDDEAAAYAAAFGTSEAKDGRGNTKPTAFHFTAANQQFLGSVEAIRAMVDADWCRESLFEGGAARRGPNLRWDPAADRSWALRAIDPQREDTVVDAPLEWLAFRALPLFPTYPVGAGLVTTAVTGRGNRMSFTWPLWGGALSLETVASVLQVSWIDRPAERAQRGVAVVCTSPIRRIGQGFGNFGPAVVVP